jgi:hypothetical protein
MGALGAGLILVLIVLALNAFVLPDIYSTSTAGQMGFYGVLAGIILSSGTLARAASLNRGSEGVVQLSVPMVPIIYLGSVTSVWLATPVMPELAAKGLHIVLVGGCLLGMLGMNMVAGHAKASDETRDRVQAGRDAMLASGQGSKAENAR